MGRVKMASSSHLGSINFADPANIRKVYKELMSELRTKAICLSNKHKIQIEPIQFEWDKFLSTFGKDFPEVLNEVLSHNNNHLPSPNSIEKQELIK